MPANVGEMFYTGEVPWHGLGISLSLPATLEEALKAGGLNWTVGDVDIMTADDPPSHILKRKALVRNDLLHGDARRVLGIVHRGFAPIQNRDAGVLFDAIFGRGERVYHTGGYLGDGEVIWLLAKINKTLEIGKEDTVQPYALMANSHDGSMAFNIRLTTIRVVCQNTLSLAMRERLGQQFRRPHQGSFAQHAQAAQEFTTSDMQAMRKNDRRAGSHRSARRDTSIPAEICDQCSHAVGRERCRSGRRTRADSAFAFVRCHLGTRRGHGRAWCPSILDRFWTSGIDP
jgi:phage/plasmid-like protein (TIGR03299 family)